MAVDKIDTEQQRPAPHPAVIVLLGTLPWLAAACGSYWFHSAVLSFALYHSLCLSFAAYYRVRFGRRSSMPFPRHHWLALAGICLAVCLVVYFAIGFLGYLAEPARVMAGLQRQHIPLHKTAYLMLFSYFALVNPVAEEFFWRGTIYSGLRRRHLGIRNSSYLTALLFGSWHWLIVRLFFPGTLALIITAGIIVVGELFCRFYERTRSLPAVCLLHGLGTDVPVLVVLWYAVLSKG
jgi:membrane protease YdiL (CAAX protease family)